MRKIDIQHDLLIADCENSNVRRFVLGCHDANLSFASMLASSHIAKINPYQPAQDVVTYCDHFKTAGCCGACVKSQFGMFQTSSRENIRPAAECNTPAACAPQI